MDYNILVHSFLKNYTKETSVKTYNKKISSFIQFLVRIKDLTDNNYKELFKSLNEEDFLNSLRDFIKNSEVEYQVTADNFITVITQFFKFLSLKYDIKNTLLIDDTKFSMFKEQADAIIHKLKTGESKEPISDEQFEYVRIGCDKIIQSYPDRGFRLYCSALIVKLTLLLGFKSHRIDKLMATDYDSKTHVLKTNSFQVHLPDKFSQQLNEYMSIRERILEKKQSSCLQMFITAGGKPLKDNGTKYYALKELVNDHQSEIISMRAIINMLKIGIPVGYIQILTGFSADTCNFCFEYLRQEEYYEGSAINRMIDSKLRLMPTFDVL